MGAGIAKCIHDLMAKLEIPLSKVISMVSDGGKQMVNVHCVVHSLSLCTIQTVEAIAALKEHQQILADVFYYFHTSPKQAAKIKKKFTKTVGRTKSCILFVGYCTIMLFRQCTPEDL